MQRMFKKEGRKGERNEGRKIGGKKENKKGAIRKNDPVERRK